MQKNLTIMVNHRNIFERNVQKILNAASPRKRDHLVGMAVFELSRGSKNTTVESFKTFRTPKAAKLLCLVYILVSGTCRDFWRDVNATKYA